MRVVARIDVLSEAEAGFPIVRRANYIPNHNFGSAENRSMFVGAIELAEDEPLVSGETRMAVVNFLSDELVRPIVKPSVKWRIQEGLTLIAEAQALEILD